MAIGKVLVCVVAPTASGKTTAARTLATELGLDFLSADRVYDELKVAYSTEGPAEDLTRFERWDDPRNFGLESWGAHDSIHEAKVECYANLLAPYRDESLILEGYTLSFALERIAVQQLMQPNLTIIIRIELEFDRWAKQFEGKFGVSAKDKENAYHHLIGQYERLDNEVLISCATPEEAVAPQLVELLRSVV